MISIARHGRLQRISRFAIFFTGLSTLVVGGIMSVSSFHQDQQEAQIQINQNLKTQAQILVDQFFTVIETMKNGADLTNLPYVTHRGIVKVDQGVPAEIESLDFIQKSGTAPDLAFDDRVLSALKKQISINDLSYAKSSIGTFEISDVGSKEGIFYATPVFAAATSPAAMNSIKIEKINVVLIDPVKALASLAKLSNSNSESSQRAFLIGSNGKILAHTVSAYVGTDLKKMDSLKETLDHLFLGAQTGAVTRYKSIDGERQQIAFVRAGAYPFAIAVEQKSGAQVFTAAWASDQLNSGAARKNLGLILILLASSLVVMSGISLWFNREIQKAFQANANPGLGLSAAAAFAEAQASVTDEWVVPKRNSVNLNDYGTPTNIPKNIPQMKPVSQESSTQTFHFDNDDVAEAANQFVESHAQLTEELNASQEQAATLVEPERTVSNFASTTATLAFNNPRSGIQEFVNRISSSYTVEGVERELVDACSKVTESPVLYFRYHKRNQNLVLASTAGSVQIQNHSVMQIYVRKDIEQQIEQLSNDGKVASVSNYGPMAKLMIANLNVAHFEAWAVTSDRSVNDNGSQMMGVVVVLQAGFKSAEARPVLGRMIREAGNYLYAQNNKIRTSNLVANAALKNAASSSASTVL